MKEAKNKLKNVIDMVNNKKNAETVAKEDTFLKWNPEDNFLFTGEEFGKLVNTMKEITNTQEFAEDLMKARKTYAIVALNEMINSKVDGYTKIGQIKPYTKAQLDAELEKEKSRVKEVIEKEQVMPVGPGPVSPEEKEATKN